MQPQTDRKQTLPTTHDNILKSEQEYFLTKEEQKQENRMVYRQLLKIVAPISFQFLMGSLVSASDAFMLGFLDQDSLSAASLATQVSFVFSLFYGALVSGLNILAAQYWGKGDKEAVEKVLAVTMRYVLLIGFLFTMATFLFPSKIMYIFTKDPVLIEKGASYLRMCSLYYILTGISQVYFGVMKVCDRAGTSSLIGSLSVVLNIILNAIFIFGLLGMPAMGITGAALATVFARIFEVAFVGIVVLQKKCPSVRIRRIFSSGDKQMHADYWKYCYPTLINQLGWGGGVTMYSVIMGHLGTDATAANSIAGIVRSMIASLCWGIAAGVSIIIGGALGRDEIAKAKRFGGKFVRLSIWIGVGSGLVIIALIPLVLRLITLTPQAAVYLKGMLLMAAYYIIGNSLNSTIIAGIFPAGGDTKFGMYCDVITLWGFVVPLGMLAAFVWKWPVLWVAFVLTLDEFVKIPAVYHHYVKYKWLKNITR